MKSTCQNCLYYQGVLENDNCHIHDFCMAWDHLMTDMYHSPVANAMNDYVNDNLSFYDGNFCGCVIYDDIEIGCAGCYRFKPGEINYDEEMSKHFYEQKNFLISEYTKQKESTTDKFIVEDCNSVIDYIINEEY